MIYNIKIEAKTLQEFYIVLQTHAWFLTCISSLDYQIIFLSIPLSKYINSSKYVVTQKNYYK